MRLREDQRRHLFEKYMPKMMPATWDAIFGDCGVLDIALDKAYRDGKIDGERAALGHMIDYAQMKIEKLDSLA